jgi:secondary thiamine-phosphate synthase enzyme
MKTHFTTLPRKTTSNTDVLDLTDDVQSCVTAAGIREGIVTIGVAGSTASVTTIEFEPGVVNDLRKAIERVAPSDIHYDHDARWGDGNGYSHVRSALLGPSATIAVHGGRLALGTWQQVVLCDFDNRGRTREVYVQILGV